MRTALDWLYRGSGVLAGFFLVCIGAMTLAQIVGRLLGFAARSYDDFAGFSMAACFFLGLAWTLRAGDHIRVNILLQQMRGGSRRLLEIACLVVATFLCGYFAWYTIDMTWTSYQINDLSQGLVAVPLWIPQLAMALGLVVLVIALVDDLVVTVKGGAPSYEKTPAAEVQSFEI